MPTPVFIVFILSFLTILLNIFLYRFLYGGCGVTAAFEPVALEDWVQFPATALEGRVKGREPGQKIADELASRNFLYPATALFLNFSENKSRAGLKRRGN